VQHQALHMKPAALSMHGEDPVRGDASYVQVQLDVRGGLLSPP
jgi:hypothetical protein